MRTLTPKDIMDNAAFAAQRARQLPEILALKQLRRLDVGPAISLHFENQATLLWQIQEMLRIEQGGDAQLQDELAAYNPLLPQGNELVATFMIEIPDAATRRRALYALTGVETTVALHIGASASIGQPERDAERTRDDGKTSAVHFLRWGLTPAQVLDFMDETQLVCVRMTHPQYTHHAVLSPALRRSLAADF